MRDHSSVEWSPSGFKSLKLKRPKIQNLKMQNQIVDEVEAYFSESSVRKRKIEFTGEKKHEFASKCKPKNGKMLAWNVPENTKTSENNEFRSKNHLIKHASTTTSCALPGHKMKYDLNAQKLVRILCKFTNNFADVLNAVAHELKVLAKARNIDIWWPQNLRGALKRRKSLPAGPVKGSEMWSEFWHSAKHKHQYYTQNWRMTYGCKEWCIWGHGSESDRWPFSQAQIWQTKPRQCTW